MSERTPLYDLHVSLGARMVPFAGYDMPVQYPTGILAEHNWTRNAAGLFDVSHMGQCLVVGPDHETVAKALEKLVPGDVLGLGQGKIRYTQLLNEQGGTLDDLMITRGENGTLALVVNASRKFADYAWIEVLLPAGVKLVRLEDRALVALQGPKAEAALARHAPDCAQLEFMSASAMLFDGMEITASRSGYTGEDGFEISVQADKALRIVEALLAEPEVKPIGLGARDSLRLEGGLCLYGHELDETISPVEAGLVWSIGKKRRIDGGFIGAERVLQELRDGPERKRVGIKPEGRAPARDGTVITNKEGRQIGVITSGGFGPTVNGPVAMGYVETVSSAPGTSIQLMVRGSAMPATIVKLPFVPNQFKR